jgi:predicted  nucleic acid-binding Zn-ribbon protein
MNRLLWELQQADNHITKLKRERSKLDDGSAARAERDTLERARDEAKTQLNALNTQRSAKEDELKTAEEKLTRQNTRLMGAKSAHEVNSLQRDIDALGKARGDLDEAILTLMDEAETATRQLADLEAQLQDQSTLTAQIEHTFAVETRRLDREIEESLALRSEISAQLDATSLQKYEEYARKYHGVAVAISENGNCSACGMAFTPFNLREAKSQTWPTCESCNRLLFVE